MIYYIIVHIHLQEILHQLKCFAKDNECKFAEVRGCKKMQASRNWKPKPSWWWGYQYYGNKTRHWPFILDICNWCQWFYRITGSILYRPNKPMESPLCTNFHGTIPWNKASTRWSIFDCTFHCYYLQGGNIATFREQILTFFSGFFFILIVQQSFFPSYSWARRIGVAALTFIHISDWGTGELVLFNSVDCAIIPNISHVFLKIEM